MSTQPPDDIAETVARALAEDVGDGDRTARLIPAGARARARVISRETAVVCGRPWVEAVYRRLDPAVRLAWQVNDGEQASPDQPLLELEGSARTLLTGERTALNFLQLLSGTATATRRYVDAVTGTRARILDTRKTLPGLRAAQKYAVRCGGGHNHRMGLFDAILIKENHILAAGSIGAAVREARRIDATLPVEVEVENLAELREGLAAGADILLLDNFALEMLRQAVRETRAAGQATRLEASGGVNLDTVAAIAATGVDRISVGGLTKDVRAVDLSMRFLSGPG
ncbi:MAG TPA: carboxylating nicotinate-nucleotide diphosphorylase [Gammaproteobacteria bacterium]|nr:carboxylating nicotinate-nucleotide diphosphorylase [Gammaproteobacteria bacterium]